jgi:hypothetical protein
MRKRVPCNKFTILRVITGVYKMRTSVKIWYFDRCSYFCAPSPCEFMNAVATSRRFYLRQTRTCNINIRYLETDIRYLNPDIRYSRISSPPSLLSCAYIRSMFSCTVRLFRAHVAIFNAWDMFTNVIWVCTLFVLTCVLKVFVRISDYNM